MARIILSHASVGTKTTCSQPGEDDDTSVDAQKISDLYVHIGLMHRSQVLHLCRHAS